MVLTVRSPTSTRSTNVCHRNCRRSCLWFLYLILYRDTDFYFLYQFLMEPRLAGVRFVYTVRYRIRSDLLDSSFVTMIFLLIAGAGGWYARSQSDSRGVCGRRDRAERCTSYRSPPSPADRSLWPVWSTSVDESSGARHSVPRLYGSCVTEVRTGGPPRFLPRLLLSRSF